MQKLFALLMLLVVLAGSVVPCCPSDNCSDDTSLSATNNKDHEQSGCSPFFACPSCAGFTQTTKLVQVMQLAGQPLVHHQHFATFSSSVYCSSLFQPPRVALLHFC